MVIIPWFSVFFVSTFINLHDPLLLCFNLERGTHDAGTFQRSELRTLRRKFKKIHCYCVLAVVVFKMHLPSQFSS